MKILIIEDDPNKLFQLQDCVRAEVPNVEILVAISYNRSLHLLKDPALALILLDMELPMFDRSPTESGGRRKSLAGHQLLRRIAKNNATVKVVVVTQLDRFGAGADAIGLEELIARLEDGEFPNYLGTIYFHANSDDWRSKLGKVIRRVGSEH